MMPVFFLIFLDLQHCCSRYGKPGNTFDFIYKHSNFFNINRVYFTVKRFLIDFLSASRVVTCEREISHNSRNFRAKQTRGLGSNETAWGSHSRSRSFIPLAFLTSCFAHCHSSFMYCARWPHNNFMCNETEMGGEENSMVAKATEQKSAGEEENFRNLRILRSNDQVKELQTILRDRNTTRSDFKFYADRLIRLVIEESLNQLPFTKCEVITPTGALYPGLKYQKGNCGVSIVRSGEAMEQGLRDCCRSIRIGKILVESDADTHEAKVVYARFPEDIADRKVLLMYPIMSTGNTVIKAVAVLKEHHVLEDNIILSNLFCTPFAARAITSTFPQMKILTSEVHSVAPNLFGQKYFGTD